MPRRSCIAISYNTNKSEVSSIYLKLNSRSQETYTKPFPSPSPVKVKPTPTKSNMDVVSELSDTRRNFANEFSESFRSNTSDEVIERSQGSYLLKRIKILERKVDKLLTIVEEKDQELDTINVSILELEKSTSRNNQYTRRENIEIIGIDNSVQQNKLEEMVVDIINNMGIRKSISSYDITGCHRLRKKGDHRNQNVIVRFRDRKLAEEILEKKRQIKNVSHKLMVTENLCPHYQKIYNFCNKMKYENRISNLWTNKGIVHFKFQDNYNEKPTKVLHYDELYDHFPEEDENSVTDIENEQNAEGFEGERQRNTYSWL